MRVVWAPGAEQDWDDEWEYIAADSVSAAARMDELLSDVAAQLADFPELGRPGKIPGTRELIPHENYRLVYEIEGSPVWMLALVHIARLWPPLLKNFAMVKNPPPWRAIARRRIGAALKNRIISTIYRRPETH